jgi:hypothetical protein
MRLSTVRTLPMVGLVALAMQGCGDDDGPGYGPGYGTQADEFGVGAQCSSSEQCAQIEGLVQSCLSFKGGYCGIRDCRDDLDCPAGSACVLHDDGETYCFRICRDKGECNVNRTLENEANCSSSIDFVDPQGSKACVPPTG